MFTVAPFWLVFSLSLAFTTWVRFLVIYIFVQATFLLGFMSLAHSSHGICLRVHEGGSNAARSLFRYFVNLLDSALLVIPFRVLALYDASMSQLKEMVRYQKEKGSNLSF